MRARGLKRITGALRGPRLLLLQKLARRIPLRPFDVGKLCFLRLDHRPLVPGAMLRGQASVRLATRGDIGALARLQHDPALFEARFSEGDRCMVACVHGEVVAYEWYCDRELHHETAWGLPIVIPRGFVYAYDCYVDPAYRNTGIWLRFKAFLGEWMLEHGKRGILTFIDYGNWPSINTHLRFGFRRAEDVVAVKAFGRSFFMHHDVACRDGRPATRPAISGTASPMTGTFR